MNTVIAALLIVVLVLLIATFMQALYASDQAIEIRRLRKLIEPFDRDGDGKPGGSIGQMKYPNTHKGA